MTLELGLTLGSVYSNYASKGFDLSDSMTHHKSSKQLHDAESRTGLIRSSSITSQWSVTSSEHCIRGNKRDSVDALGSADDRTLPLLNWDKQPNEEDDGNFNRNCSLANRERKFREGLVGWPPVKERGINARRRNRRTPKAEKSCGACGRTAAGSRYVKLKMEGVGIGRKINISLFDSVQMLKTTSASMFDQEDVGSYRMIYKDEEGDWLLAEDIPWRTISRSVQQLKLQRIN